MAHLRTVRFPWTKAGFSDDVEVIYFQEAGCVMAVEGRTIFLDMINPTDGRIWAKIGIGADEARILAASLLGAADAVEDNGD